MIEENKNKKLEMKQLSEKVKEIKDANKSIEENQTETVKRQYGVLPSPSTT